jgi:hypothetical protein
MRKRYRWNPETRKLEQIAFGPVDFGQLIMADLPGYVSPVSGKWVEGRKARRDDLARTHSRPYEGREQEQKEIERQRRYDEARQEKRIDESANRAWAEAPERVRKVFRSKG